MKKAHCLSAPILAICFFAGCASPTPTGSPSGMAWNRPDTSSEEMRHDLAICQYDALSTRRATSVYGDTVGHTILLQMVADKSEDSKENQMIAACMSAKGYTLGKTNSPSANQTSRLSPELESKLIGRWESISFKTKVADKDQAEVDKQVFVFFPNQRLLNETVYKNGKTEPRLVHYNIDSDKMVMTDPLVVRPYTKTIAKYSLIDDQMILTSDNLQMILHKVPETNGVPESDNLLLGRWACSSKTNAIASKMQFKIMPHNRYNYQFSLTSPKKTKNEDEDGIYCYDADQFLIVFWSDKDSEPQWYKWYIVGDKMNLVVGKVSVVLSRESD
ncbi:MAG TPA: hypothetical protein VG347_17030 [Verrucomicrobiae bacterium]|nr:hypothetical protein [Verrucomicrobiae bacterium]